MEPKKIGTYPTENGYYAPLLVISNHPPEKWDDKQRKGWEIYYLPFPNVPADADEEQVSEMVRKLAKICDKFLVLKTVSRKHNEDALPMISIQGEFTLTFSVIYQVGVDFFVFPTSERKVKELENGKKLVNFEFVRWRHLSKILYES